MVDISILDNYKIELTPFQYQFISNEITTYGLNKVIDYYYYTLDCSRINKDGLRLMQTITFPYRSDISELIHIVDKYVENQLDKDKYYNKLIELHLKNLKFEELNPPVDYKKKIKSKRKSSTEKVKPAKDKTINKNISSAEAKLKEIGLNLNNLKLKL